VRCVKAQPTLLRELLRYDPETGVLVWFPRPIEWFKDGAHSAEHSKRKWDARYAGRPAFTCKNNHGYLHSGIGGVDLLAHRVAFAIMAGDWPQGHVDHINGERTDNRWGNLREVNATESSLNCKVRTDSRSGVTGVSWNSATQKWVATFAAYGCRRYLGSFDDLQGAIQARRNAEAVSVVLPFLRKHVA
jgi:hypothetical protein